METKGEVRRRLRAARRRIVATRDPAADADAIAAGVAPFVADLAGPATVLSYESLPHEPPTDAVHAALLAAGHRVLVPITLPDLRLDWLELGWGRLDDPDRPPLGLDAPRSADLALVPALAVDEAGTRLGQGGGCYDRVLPMLAPGVPVLVLLHPGEHTHERLPREDHDAPVEVVLTADGRADAASPLTTTRPGTQR